MSSTASVDLEGISVLGDLDITAPDVQKVADKIVQILKAKQFVYIINHGVEKTQMDKLKAVAKTFFSMSVGEKEKFKSRDDYGGWTGIEREVFDPSRPGDYKEAYNFSPWQSRGLVDEKHPEIPGFEESFQWLCDTGFKLNMNILRLIALGLKLDDTEFFVKHHAAQDVCQARCAFYPPIPANSGLKPGQLRCGEHSDFGSVSLIFQDDAGGLQVCNKEGKFVPVNPVDGAIVVLTGDLMQRWTSDRLIAAKHRVVIPEEDIVRQRPRWSYIFFSYPDNHVLVECLDGSSKYQPVLAMDYVHIKFNETLQEKKENIE